MRLAGLLICMLFRLKCPLKLLRRDVAQVTTCQPRVHLLVLPVVLREVFFFSFGAETPLVYFLWLALSGEKNAPFLKSACRRTSFCCS